MVEKNKMLADFEQLTYSGQMLRETWKDKIDLFKKLVNGGWTSDEMVVFVECLSETKWAERFFPGSSLGTLLISKPRNGKLNYQQTLAIRYDKKSNLFIMEYSDWDTIETKDESKKAILWTKKCKGNELNQGFKEFLKWNKNWG